MRYEEGNKRAKFRILSTSTTADEFYKLLSFSNMLLFSRMDY